ncbi:hypothetical protein PVAP13_2KG040100 [Panicum virgatum]|uniref:Uncharacterized protein n=1 Tax=Panicum virgatum TaxID=38727 RepID=A0A8T0VX08_PANVG|nr:hypothetical protein PVAP13_2KG040100 [Panicum virgatum]
MDRNAACILAIRIPACIRSETFRLPLSSLAMRSMVHKFIMLPVIKIGFAITCSPGALTRSRAKKIAMEEAEVHGRMALEHLMQF